MSKAIKTKYIGPGNVRGSRIKATDGDGNSVTVSYNSSRTSEMNHASAAADLLAKMGWTGTYVGGHMLKAGRSGAMVWVCSSDAQAYGYLLQASKAGNKFEVSINGGKR